MVIFVSHATEDNPAVRELVADLGAARQQVWFDSELRGGDIWWQTILEKIRMCSLFVFAMSDNSLRSKPCMAEVEYAKALRIPILPVQIGPVMNIGLVPIADIQILDYRIRNAGAGIALVDAVRTCIASRRHPPSPPPRPPEVPFEYLYRLSRTIDRPRLNADDQVAVFAQLKNGLENENDERARNDLFQLLTKLRERPDTTYPTGRAIDAMLASPPGLSRGNDTFKRRRITDAQTLLTHLTRPPGGQTGTPVEQGNSPHLLSFVALSLPVLVLAVLDIAFSNRNDTATLFGLALAAVAIICGAVALGRRERLGAISLIVAVSTVVVAFVFHI